MDAILPLTTGGRRWSSRSISSDELQLVPPPCCVSAWRACGAVPAALAAQPLGHVPLQEPLQQVFELGRERVGQLHVLGGAERHE